MQSIQSGGTFAIDGAPGAGVAAGTILIASGANAGNAKVSTAKAAKFLGVTQEASDAKGYAAVAQYGVVDVVAGAGGVAFGDLIASDAAGAGVTVVPAANGAAVTQVVGVALTAAIAGASFKMLIQPSLTLS